MKYRLFIKERHIHLGVWLPQKEIGNEGMDVRLLLILVGMRDLSLGD